MSSPASIKSTRSFSRKWLGVLLLLAFLALGISTLFLQKQLRRNQELRGQASVSTGPVTITSTSNSVSSGTTSFITLGIDTHNVQLRELGLNFDLLLPASFTATPSGNVQITSSTTKLTLLSAAGVIAEPLPTGQKGWRIAITASPNPTTAGYSTPDTIEDIIRIEVPMPVTTGQLQVKFDPGTSHAYAWAQPPAQPTEDLLAIIPDLNMDIAQPTCTYSYSAWSACQNGQQTRTYTAQPTTCAAPDPSFLTQTCLPQCQYTYSDWGNCVNGWQTRTYSQTPASCTWYTTESLQPLTQSCVQNTANKDFSVYTYESCWSTQSSGPSTYIMWNKTKFPGVSKIDVSTTADFSSFGNKDVTNATTTFGADYLVTDGTNFRTYDSNQQLWVFWPGYTYYFRLFYENGQHSPVISYFVPKCAGTSTVSYKLCNETCSSNAECSPNLACIGGQCRRADNSGSDICAAQPDQGLKRSCNDYCADSTECGGGLTCWWNRCRATKNLDDTSCRTAPVRRVVVSGSTAYTNYVPVGTGVAEVACNGSCNSNRDCAANLRCYQGACRLPENVTNTSCLTVADQRAVTPSVTVVPSTEPTLVPMVTKTPDSTANWATWFGSTGKWLAGRLGFLVIGLVVAIIAILVWPMLRTSFVPAPRPQPMATKPPMSLMSSASPQPQTPPVHQSVTQVMTPPGSAMLPKPPAQPPQSQPPQVS